MATKRIKATVPFTYLYPENKPHGKESLLWYKGEATINTDGGSEYVDGDGDFWDHATADTINLIYDGTLYENVPGGGGSYGDNTFTDYPFYIVNDDSVMLYAQTAGTHTIELPAGEFDVHELTVTARGESTIYCNFNTFTDDGVIVSVEEEIAPGASETKACILCSMYSGAPECLASAYNLTKLSGTALYDLETGAITLPEGATNGDLVARTGNEG